MTAIGLCLMAASVGFGIGCGMGLCGCYARWIRDSFRSVTD